MTSNQVVLPMFDFNTYICMVRFILWSGGDEDPGYFFIDSGCIGVYSDFIGAQIHSVCLVAMFNFESLTHRSTVYFWWLCSYLSHHGMDPQCMFGGHDLSYLTWIFACHHLCFDSFVFWVWEFLPQWWYIIVLYFLVCWQVSDRHVPCFLHTLDKVF